MHLPLGLAQFLEGLVEVAAAGMQFGQAEESMQGEGVGTAPGLLQPGLQRALGVFQVIGDQVQFGLDQVQAAEQQAVDQFALADQGEALFQQGLGPAEFAAQQEQADAVEVDQYLEQQAALAAGDFQRLVQVWRRLFGGAAGHGHSGQAGTAEQDGHPVVFGQMLQGLAAMPFGRGRGLAAQGGEHPMQGLPVGQQLAVALGAGLGQEVAELADTGLGLVQAPGNQQAPGVQAE
ncbi:hypothetical protein D9M71_403920 [compost metagenome]